MSFHCPDRSPIGPDRIGGAICTTSSLWNRRTSFHLKGYVTNGCLGAFRSTGGSQCSCLRPPLGDRVHRTASDERVKLSTWPAKATGWATGLAIPDTGLSIRISGGLVLEAPHGQLRTDLGAPLDALPAFLPSGAGQAFSTTARM